MNKNFNYTRVILLVIIIIVFLGFSKPEDHDLFYYLPKLGEIVDWAPVDSSKRFEGDSLYDYINGGADIYLEYGFIEVIAMDYANIKNKFIQLEIYQMENNESAYGIYSLNKGNEGKSPDIGNEAFLGDYYLIFWKDNFLVTLTGYSSDDETVKGLIALAQNIDKKIEKKGVKPHLTEILPKENLLETENKYIKGNIGLINNYFFASGNIFGLKEGVIGNYGDYQVYIFKYDSDKESRKWFLNAEESIRNNDKYSNYTSQQNSFSVFDRKQKPVYCKTYQNYIFIILETSVNDKSMIIDRIVENIQTNL